MPALNRHCDVIADLLMWPCNCKTALIKPLTHLFYRDYNRAILRTGAEPGEVGKIYSGLAFDREPLTELAMVGASRASVAFLFGRDSIVGNFKTHLCSTLLYWQ